MINKTLQTRSWEVVGTRFLTGLTVWLAGISKSTLEGQAPPPVWHAQGATAPPSPPARALPVDYLAFFTSDYFKDMSDT